MEWGLKARMPKYTAIGMNVEIMASRSDMVNLYWRYGTVVADFLIPQDHFSYLRVRFGRTDILRTVDEMVISTEEVSGERNGFVRDHLAYSMEDTFFGRPFQRHTNSRIRKRATIDFLRPIPALT
jgi:hypothetical protein